MDEIFTLFYLKVDLFDEIFDNNDPIVLNKINENIVSLIVVAFVFMIMYQEQKVSLFTNRRKGLNPSPRDPLHFGKMACVYPRRVESDIKKQCLFQN